MSKSEVLAIVGKNGMGKTSLLKAVLGFLPAWRGTIRLDGRDITSMPPHLKRRLGLVYVPQEQALFQDLTIRDNLRLGLLSDRELDKTLDQADRSFPILRSDYSNEPKHFPVASKKCSFSLGPSRLDLRSCCWMK